MRSVTAAAIGLIFRLEQCQMPRMNENLHQFLEEHFYPPAAHGLDAVLRLQIGDTESLIFRVANGTIDFSPDPSTPADTTFRFADGATAKALFSGSEDAFQAFMDGRFRADGYLMWAFTLMAMFRSASLPATPTE